MKYLLLVGAGSFIGGIIRFLLSEWIQTKSLSSFPYGTLSVNLIGCFAIGVVYAFFEKELMSMEWRLFLATGVLGGFTTFSAFSMETFSLIRNGSVLHALIYVGVSIIIGILATVIGFSIIKSF